MTKILQSIPYPTYTTAERDLLVDVLKNTYINNSDTGKVEEFDGVNWISDTTDLTNYIKKINESLPLLTGNSISTPYSPLYNKYVVDDPRGVAPIGFHIPTESDVLTLTINLGNSSIAGREMKESGTSHWNSPNSFSNNSSGFSAIPTGYRYYDAGEFSEQGYSYWFYTTTGSRKLTVASEAILNGFGGNNNGFNIRCIKDDNIPSTSPIIDASGNFYTEITIANQIWLVEDLRTTKYNNGDDIPNILDNNDWIGATSGALCYYNNETPPNYNEYIDYGLMVLTSNGYVMKVNKEQFISHTNLSSSGDTETLTIFSDTGTDTTLVGATEFNAGVLGATDKLYINNIKSLSGSTYIKNISNVSGTTVTDALNNLQSQIQSSGDTIPVENITVWSELSGYTSGNTFVSYINTGSSDPQFQNAAIYRCIIDTIAGESPETNPEKWEFNGQYIVVSNANTSITTVQLQAHLKQLTGYKTSHTVAVIGDNIVYKYDPTTNSGIKPNDNPPLGSWVFMAYLKIPTPINSGIAWSGNTYQIPLSSEQQYRRIISSGTTTLSFSLLFNSDSTIYKRNVCVIIDNSSNTSPISSITFTGGNWRWDVGVQPTGLAAGAIATLEIYNESNIDVKPNWTVRA